MILSYQCAALMCRGSPAIVCLLYKYRPETQSPLRFHIQRGNNKHEEPVTNNLFSQELNCLAHCLTCFHKQYLESRVSNYFHSVSTICIDT